MSEITESTEFLGVERSSTDLQTTSQNSKELVEAPKWASVLDTDVVDAVLPDMDAEYTLKRVYYRATGTGSFTIHNGTGTALMTVSFTANQGIVLGANIPMGFGEGIFYNSTLNSGLLEIQVDYSTKRKTYRRRALAYIDAPTSSSSASVMVGGGGGGGVPLA